MKSYTQAWRALIRKYCSSNQFFFRLMLLFVLVFIMLCGFTSNGQQVTATEIIKRSEDHLRGETSIAEVSIDIIRPDWTRTIKLKGWSKGVNYSMILIQSPVKDKGIVFLKRQKEVWNWIPSVERTIKLPPSMMAQSWMGTDFTNDDLVREYSVIHDYTQRIIGDSMILGRKCWKIEMIPLPQSAIVWGKVLLWIDQQDYMQLRTEFIDEDNIKIQVMQCTEVKKLGGRMLPCVMEMIPLDKPGHKTIMRYESLLFNQPIADDFFTTQNIKKVQ